MQWYFSKGGAQQGPVSTEELRAKISSGEVAPTDLVWKEGMSDWTAANRVSDLAAPASAPAAPTTVASPVVTPSYQQTPVNPASPVQMGVPGGLPAAAGSKATQAQVLGIVGIVLAILCACFGGLPCGILAIVFGNQYKSMAAAAGVEGPDIGKAKAGILMGWIAIVLALVMSVLVFFVNQSFAEQIRIEMEKAKAQQERVLESAPAR